MDGVREVGVVVHWLDSFGFIDAGDGNGDVFMHRTAIVSRDEIGAPIRTLKPGQRVSFVRGFAKDGRPAAQCVEVL